MEHDWAALDEKEIEKERLWNFQCRNCGVLRHRHLSQTGFIVEYMKHEEYASLDQSCYTRVVNKIMDS